MADFLEPGIDRMTAPGHDQKRLERGLAHLRSIPERPDGSMTQIVHRAHARKRPPDPS